MVVNCKSEKQEITIDASKCGKVQKFIFWMKHTI